MCHVFLKTTNLDTEHDQVDSDRSFKWNEDCILFKCILSAFLRFIVETSRFLECKGEMTNSLTVSW